MVRHFILLIFTTILLSSPSKSDFSSAFIEVAKKGNPTVVSIVSEKTVKNEFHQFMFPWGGNQFEPQERKGQGLGSGVIIDSRKGFIITNNHVIEDADEIKIILEDKREIDAEVIGTDPMSDIALLKIDTNDISSAKMGNSDILEIGEWVVAIGSPFGLHLNHTVTAGIVSAKGRSDVISRLNYEDFIQHDAAINPGNSGGALFDLDGNLVGINTAIATGGYSRANAGVGFAIPINQVKRVIEDLISDGKVMRGWLGVTIQDIDDNMAKALNLDSRDGAIISQVMADSPADNAGIKEQDVIIKIDGETVNDASDLKLMVSSGHPNDISEFLVIRDEKKKYIKVKLGERPDENELRIPYASEGSFFDKLGLKVENNDEDEGIIITEVKPNSSSYENNIRKGDVITKIGRTNIQNVSEYKSELDSYSSGDAIVMRIIRNKTARLVAFEIE